MHTGKTFCFSTIQLYKLLYICVFLSIKLRIQYDKRFLIVDSIPKIFMNAKNAKISTINLIKSQKRMRTSRKTIKVWSLLTIVICVLCKPTPVVAFSPALSPATELPDRYIEYKGIVVDRKTRTRLSFATLTLVGTNNSTVTNVDGQFSIKVPKDKTDPKIMVSFIGFKSKIFPLEKLLQQKSYIELEPTASQLPELNVISKDANALMVAVMEKKSQNYFNEVTPMMAFYREAIKKNRTYVSLSEAVVYINKQPYNSLKYDEAMLYKSRKKTDYTKLDTITFKLQGGPISSLYLDMMKYPDFIFTDKMFEKYDFTFDRSTYIDDRLIFEVNFKQKPAITEPLYYGKLYIDAQSLAIKSGVFKLNLTNKEEASDMFVIKKPYNAKVYPVEANYRIDYNEQNGKWYYGYSRIEFGLRINWKRKLFNTTYYSTIEMAVTDWGKSVELPKITRKERLRSTVIISDEAAGFADPQFWGKYNVIEPEKPIENAINKIQKQFEKAK